MSFPHGEPVVIVRPETSTDRYGNRTLDWGETREFTLASCGVAPGAPEEEMRDREHGVVIDHTLYVTPDVATGVYGWSVYGESLEAIWPTDRLRFRGEDHEVVGRIRLWVSPFTGRRAGVVVSTRRVEG